MGSLQHGPVVQMAQHNGMQDSEDRRYLVEFTEPALVEADAVYLWLSEQTGLEYAIRWYEGLFLAAQELSSLPRIHAIAPENERYDVEVRRLLYSGPSGRRGKSVYRLLFYIIEPQESEAEGVVRILHIWHGAKGSLS
jgi:plasmid stabilization system protein ParE